MNLEKIQIKLKELQAEFQADNCESLLIAGFRKDGEGQVLIEVDGSLGTIATFMANINAKMPQAFLEEIKDNLK